MKNEFTPGMRDAVPVALGYLAVSFTLAAAWRGRGLAQVAGAACLAVLLSEIVI